MRGREVLAAVGLSGAALLGGVACSEADQTKAALSVPEQESTTTVAEYALLSQYLTSAERIQTLDETLETIGNQIVDLAESGEVGYFDAYHPQAGTWRSQEVTEGWVLLQHNPQYGGTEDQLSVTVWQNEDGTFDRSRGFLSVGLSYNNSSNPDDGIAVQLDVPGAFTVATEGGQARPGSVHDALISYTLGTEIADVYSTITADNAQQAQDIDFSVVSQLEAYFADR